MNKYYDKAILFLLRNKVPAQIRSKNLKEYDTIDLLFFNHIFAKLAVSCFIYMHIHIIVWGVLNITWFKALIIFTMIRSLISNRHIFKRLYLTKLCLYDLFYPTKELN